MKNSTQDIFLATSGVWTVMYILVTELKITEIE